MLIENVFIDTLHTLTTRLLKLSSGNYDFNLKHYTVNQTFHPNSQFYISFQC